MKNEWYNNCDYIIARTNNSEYEGNNKDNNKYIRFIFLEMKLNEIIANF